MATKEALLVHPHPQFIEERASHSLETRRIPDPYWFWVDSSGKLTASDGQLIESSIEKTSFVGQLEFQAFLRIQEWVQENSEGVAFWVSPKGPYATTKIIASEIVFVRDRKLLFNTAIILDSLNTKDCVRLVNNFSSREFSSVEEVRANPVFVRLPVGMPWHRVLEEHTAAPDVLRQIKDGGYIELKQKTLRQIEEILDQLPSQTQTLVYTKSSSAYSSVFENQLRQAGLVGEHPDSCSYLPTAFSLFFNHSLQKWEYHPGSCVVCGATGIQVGPCKICKSCEAKFN